MKENVFSREEPDGSVTVYSPDHGIEANGYDQQDACDKFIRAMREKYPFNQITVQAATE